MTPSKILLYFCLAFICGIFFYSFFIDNHGKEGFVNLVGIISKEPDVSQKSQRIVIKTEGRARILATTLRYPEYKYGDKLKIIGNLEAPSENINGFNYKNYLAKDGIYSVMSFPEIEIIGQGFCNPIVGALISFKNKFKNIAESFISPPEVGILESLIFGDEGQISKDWQEKLNLTGTRHIAAVSGMNITIIASFILTFLLSLGLWRGQAFYLSVALLLLYILMIGAPASSV